MNLSKGDRKKIQGAIDYAKQAQGEHRTLPAGPGPLSPRTGFWAKITGEGTGSNAGKYSWTKQHPSETPGDFEDFTDVTGVLNAYEIHGQRAIPVDSLVWLVCIGYDSGTPYYVFQGRLPYQPFIVKVTQSGGSAGNKTTKCSYTYTIQHYVTEASLSSSALAPEVDHRVAKGRYVAATKGEAYYDNSGTIKLWRVFEVDGVGEC